MLSASNYWRIGVREMVFENVSCDFVTHVYNIKRPIWRADRVINTQGIIKQQNSFSDAEIFKKGDLIFLIQSVY